MPRSSPHPLNGRYWAMRHRCYRPENKNFLYYGGRGITVCPRWLSDRRNFIADMEPGWFPGATIDRIDNDGPYSPENCRWATRVQQLRNTRKTIWVDYQGERMPLPEASERSGVNHFTIRSRLKKGKPVLFAPSGVFRVATPVGLMTRSEVKLLYGIGHNTLTSRLARGLTWETGLLRPPHKWVLKSGRVAGRPRASLPDPPNQCLVVSARTTYKRRAHGPSVVAREGHGIPPDTGPAVLVY